MAVRKNFSLLKLKFFCYIKIFNNEKNELKKKNIKIKK